VKRLTILFDTRCTPCRHLRRWMEAQPTYVPMELLGARSPAATRRFPEIAPGAEEHTPLVAVDEAGRIWRGEGALRMCLWALRAWRAASLGPRAARGALLEHDAARADDDAAAARLAKRPYRVPAFGAGRTTRYSPDPDSGSGLRLGFCIAAFWGIAFLVVLASWAGSLWLFLAILLVCGVSLRALARAARGG
jgi:predicted DCC family thiol-disulfide oxidoreductase YuxK